MNAPMTHYSMLCQSLIPLADAVAEYRADVNTQQHSGKEQLS